MSEWRRPKPRTIPNPKPKRAHTQVACVRCFTPVTDPELVKLHVCEKHLAYAVVG